MEGGPADRQGAQMREKESGCRRSVVGKVAATEIVEKANPEKGGGDNIERDIWEKKRRSEEEKGRKRKSEKGKEKLGGGGGGGFGKRRRDPEESLSLEGKQGAKFIERTKT